MIRWRAEEKARFKGKRAVVVWPRRGWVEGLSVCLVGSSGSGRGVSGGRVGRGGEL